MPDPATARAFLLAEVDALEPFAFLLASPAGQPLHTVEVTRSEGGDLEVRIPGRPPIVPELAVSVRSELRERGFSSEKPDDPTLPWVHPVGGRRRRPSISCSACSARSSRRSPTLPSTSRTAATGRNTMRARSSLPRVSGSSACLNEKLGHRAEQDEDGDYPRSDGRRARHRGAARGAGRAAGGARLRDHQRRRDGHAGTRALPGAPELPG